LGEVIAMRNKGGVSHYGLVAIIHIYKNILKEKRRIIEKSNI
jgi:hypothetical protein